MSECLPPRKRGLIAICIVLAATLVVLAIAYVNSYGIGPIDYSVPVGFVTKYIQATPEERPGVIKEYWMDCDEYEVNQRISPLLLGNTTEAVEANLTFSSLDYLEFELLDAAGSVITPPVGLFVQLNSEDKITSVKISRQQPFSRYDSQYNPLWE